MSTAERVDSLDSTPRADGLRTPAEFEPVTVGARGRPLEVVLLPSPGPLTATAEEAGS